MSEATDLIAARLESSARALLRRLGETGVCFVPRLTGAPFQLMRFRLAHAAAGEDPLKHRGYRLFITPRGRLVAAVLKGADDADTP